MTILYKVTYSKEDPYYECDNCGALMPGRRDWDENKQPITRPPIGWILPRRSREMFNPNVVPEFFCSFRCYQVKNGRDPDDVSEPPEIEPEKPTPEIVTAPANAKLPPPPEHSRYGTPAAVR